MFRTINDVSSRVVHDIIHQHPRWFTNYQLVRFNDTDYQSLTDSTNPEDFIQGITTAYNYNQQHSDVSLGPMDNEPFTVLLFQPGSLPYPPEYAARPECGLWWSILHLRIWDAQA